MGLPPGSFPLDIFGMVLNGITVRGSIVGTRLDLRESLEFAAQGKVAATVAADTKTGARVDFLAGSLGKSTLTPDFC